MFFALPVCPVLLLRQQVELCGTERGVEVPVRPGVPLVPLLEQGRLGQVPGQAGGPAVVGGASRPRAKLGLQACGEPCEKKG